MVLSQNAEKVMLELLWISVVRNMYLSTLFTFYTFSTIMHCVIHISYPHCVDNSVDILLLLYPLGKILHKV